MCTSAATAFIWLSRRGRVFLCLIRDFPGSPQRWCQCC